MADQKVTPEEYVKYHKDGDEWITCDKNGEPYKVTRVAPNGK